jgi:RND family efflux transporter MFP subunit
MAVNIQPVGETPRDIPFRSRAGFQAQAMSQVPMWRQWVTKRSLIAGGVVLALALGGTYYAMQPAAPAAGPKGTSDLTVTVVPIRQVTMARKLEINGSLRAFDELPLGTETSGLVIKQVLVDEGDHVSAGQLLARFNDDLLRADVVQKEALLREAEANAAEGLANIRRAEELLKTGAISQRDADNRRALASTADARVGVARATLEQARSRLRQADIRAPSDGIITYRGARVGAVMSAGGPELFRLLRDSRLELAADVIERDLIDIKPGQTVNLNIDTPSGTREVAGQVRLVSPSVDPKTRLGLVRIDVPIDPDLRAGMYTHGRIVMHTSTALAVPEPAVVYQAAKPIVFVVDAESKAHVRQVLTGEREGGMIAITGSVAAGDRVVQMGAGYLKEGEKVVVSDKMPDVEIKPVPKLN